MPNIGAKITLGGALPSGEGWQAGFYIMRDDATDMSLSEAIDAADGWMGGFTDSGVGLMGQYDPGTTFGAGRVQLFNATTGLGTVKGIGSVGGAGTESGAGGPLPPEVCAVITLRGSGSFSKTHGRFYLPAPLAVCVDNKGRMREETWTKYGNAIAQAATEMALGTSSHVKMAIWSKVHTTLMIARRAEVGDVWDSQRSRRNKLVETRKPILIGTAF